MNICLDLNFSNFHEITIVAIDIARDYPVLSIERAYDY